MWSYKIILPGDTMVGDLSLSHLLTPQSHNTNPLLSSTGFKIGSSFPIKFKSEGDVNLEARSESCGFGGSEDEEDRPQVKQAGKSKEMNFPLGPLEGNTAWPTAPSLVQGSTHHTSEIT